MSYFVYGNKINFDKLHLGHRGEKVRAWVYLTDKQHSEKATISEKALNRRLTSRVNSDNLWQDYSVSQSYKNAIIKQGIEIQNESRWLNAVSVLCSVEKLEKLASYPFVKKIEPVVGYKKRSIRFNNISLPNNRDFDYGVAQPQIEQINVHELHNAGYTGEGVRILVMDTGFNLTHSSLTNINVIAQWDVINDDNETANETTEESGNGQDFHGTAVLSTMASFAPGDFIGAAFDAEYLLAKTEDVSQEIQQEEDNYVAGLEWGEANGADVVSTSLGYLDWYNYEDMDGNTAVTTIAVDLAVGLGMVCVTAAGNSGNDSWYYIIAPADADSVISVGAVRENGTIGSFSSHGPTYDGRIKPEVCARGVYTWCINPGNTSTYTQMSGTSLATPLVGAAIALIRQAQPNWSAMDVREAVLMTSSQAETPDNTYGYGIMNAQAAVEYNGNVGTDSSLEIPKSISISSIYPNPFNSKVSIHLSVPQGQSLSVQVLSISGQVIETIFAGHALQPNQQLFWEPKFVPSGVYFVSASNEISTQVQKITYLK